MGHLGMSQLFLLCLAGFVSSFIDSTVGGGGLISLPALLISGLPPAFALGTNKLAGTISALTSTISYLKSGKIAYKLIVYLVPLSFIGAIFGAELIKYLPIAFLKPMVIVLLIAVTIYTLVKKEIGMNSHYAGLTKRIVVVSAVVALTLGFYDGFFGPGTGSFLIIAFVMLGFDFIQASGNAKALNLASNLAALVTFASLHFINYEYGLVMGIGMLVGAIAGSQIAIRKGVTYVRPIFICVTILMIGKQVWSYLF